MTRKLCWLWLILGLSAFASAVSKATDEEYSGDDERVDFGDDDAEYRDLDYSEEMDNFEHGEDEDEDEALEIDDEDDDTMVGESKSNSGADADFNADTDDDEDVNDVVTEYNDDEFEGIPLKKNQQPTRGRSRHRHGNGGGAAVRGHNGPPTATELVDRYKFEMVAIVFIVAYAVVFFVGCQTNQSIVDAWCDEFGDLLTKQFFACGLGNPATGKLYMKEGQAQYLLYSSGRTHCSGALLSFDLRYRHDLLSLAYEIVQPAEDVLRIDIPINDDDMGPFVFAVVRRRDLKKVLEEYHDLKDFAQVINTDKLPSSLVVLTDCRELSNDLLTPRVVSTLKKYEKHFKSMHFTDQNQRRLTGLDYKSNKNLMSFSFILPSRKEMAGLDVFMRMSFYFIDLLAQTKLTREARARAEKARSKVKERNFAALREEREETAQRKKLEKEEQMRDTSELSREAARKKEAKLRKRESKQKNPRMKMMKA